MRVCPKCGVNNDDTDDFCFSCGAPLKMVNDDRFGGNNFNNGGPGSRNGTAAGAAQPSRVNGTAKAIAVGSRKAIEADLKGLRPVTRMAYYVVQSDNTTWLRTGLWIMFIAACVAIVAIIRTIYNHLQAVVETSAFNAKAETPLVELFRSSTADHWEKMFVYVILLFIVVFMYIVIGRLLLRIKKVKRKRKKVEQKDMI